MFFRGGSREDFKFRKFFMLLHGLGLAVALVAGFGLIAKAGYHFTAGWIWGKIGIWLVLGAYPVIFFKRGKTRLPFLILMMILFTAAYLVEYKPLFL